MHGGGSAPADVGGGEGHTALPYVLILTADADHTVAPQPSAGAAVTLGGCGCARRGAAARNAAAHTVRGAAAGAGFYIYTPYRADGHKRTELPNVSFSFSSVSFLPDAIVFGKQNSQWQAWRGRGAGVRLSPLGWRGVDHTPVSILSALVQVTRQPRRARDDGCTRRMPPPPGISNLLV
eukprot:gene4520-biopygen4684